MTDPASDDAGSFHWHDLFVMLNITVNDTAKTVPVGTSVQALLNLLGMKPRFLAVELNRRVIPRGDHLQTILSDGDRIEIVTLVGGG